MFEEVYTYEREGNSLILVYQNNKLMHKKEIEKVKDTVFEFHLTKNVEPNLTFSDVQPTDRLLSAIKTVVNGLNFENSNSLKRERSLGREKDIGNMEEGELEEEPKVKKAVKTN